MNRLHRVTSGLGAAEVVNERDASMLVSDYKRDKPEVVFSFGVFVIVGVCYAAGAVASWRLFGAADIGLVFFPPAGVTLAVMVLLPRRQWWAVVAAIVVAEIGVDLHFGLRLNVAAGYAMANAVEPLVGVMLLLRWGNGRVELAQRAGFLRFLVAAVGVGAACGAVIGGFVRSYDSDVAWLSAALRWWAGDGLGILTIATPILTWRHATQLRGRNLAEAVVAFVAIAIVSIVSFWWWAYPPAFLMLPALVWVALRFAMPGVAIASAVMALIANISTAAGHGPFAALSVSAQTQLTVAQLSVASLTITMWFLAIEGSERVEAGIQREAERAARVRAESGRSLGELSDALMRQSTVDDIVRTVAAHISPRLELSFVAVGLYDMDRDRFRIFPTTLPEPVAGTVAGWDRLTDTPGPVAMRTSASVWAVDKADLTERFPAVRAVADGLGTHSLGALPVRFAGESRGYLVVARNHDRPFGLEEREALEAVAQSVGPAIQRAGLYDAERAARLEAQLLTDQSPLIIWVTGANGEQEWTNQTFCEFFGVRRGDMRGDRWQILVHPDDADEFAGAFARAVAERQLFHSCCRVRRADGAWRWVESWGQPRFDPAGAFLGHVGGSADVTDRRQAEADLAAAHAFTREVTALTPGVLSVFDLDQKLNVFTSAQCLSIIGYGPEEITALAATFLPTVLHPDDAAAFDAHLEAARGLVDNESISHDYRLRHKNGQWRWLRTTSVPLRRAIGGEVAQLTGLTVDITEQRRYEEELQAEAANEAFGTRLADALHNLEDTELIETTAMDRLVKHLDHVEASVRAIDDAVPHATSHAHTASFGHLVTQVHQLDDYGEMVVRALKAGETVTIDDVSSDDRLESSVRRTMASLGIGSVVLQPIVGHDENIRLVVVSRREPRTWSRHEVDAIVATTERIINTSERSRNERIRTRQRDRVAMAAQLLTQLNTATDTDEMFELIVDTLVPAVADYAIIEESAPESRLLALSHHTSKSFATLEVMREQHRLRLTNADVAARAAHRQEPRLVSRPSALIGGEYPNDPVAAELIAQLTSLSHMVIPITFDQRHGALILGRSDPGRDPLTEADLAFFVDFGRQLEVAITVRLVRDAEHNIAVTLQNALLPDLIRWDPSAVIEAHYRAASNLLQVGGDWYDTFTWPDGSIGVMVGDVVGHNLESAAAMGRLRSAASALAAVGTPSPAALLEALDRFARSPDGVDFATAVCVVLRPTGLLTYSSAGHPPPVVVSPDRTVVLLEGATAPPLSAGDLAPRPEASIALEAGSLVALFSDGLVERRGESIDVGLARLGVALVDHNDKPIADMIDNVIRELTSVSPASDDVVVAAFRYTPAVAQLHLEAPAQTNQLKVLRSTIRGWLHEQHVTIDTQQALLVALGEACTNVIDHAYRRNPQTPISTEDHEVEPLIEIDLTDHGDKLIARVSDHGCWRHPGMHSHDRGRGTTIMQGLTSRYERQSTSRGTTVTLAVLARSRLHLADQ